MKRTNIRSICLIAMMAAVIMVSSFIAIPIPFSTVAVTAQTLAIALTGLLLSPKEGGAAVLVYIFLAIIMGRFSIGPATGYFVGFFLSAVLISLLKGSKINPIRYFLAAIVAVLVTNTCGTISMELATGMGWKAAFLSGFVVFLPGDICKAIAAALLGAALNKALTKLPARA